MVDVSVVSRMSDQSLKEFSRSFLVSYLEPAFGATSKFEIDLLVFRLMHQCEAIPAGATQYDVARLLQISPIRVRKLTMEMRLRDAALTDENLRGQIIKCLTRSKFTKDGSQIRFGVEDPLLREDIAARLKKVGATADSSFNREIVRIQIDAFVDFLDSLMPEDRKKTVQAALRKAGVEEKGLRGVLRGAIGKLGEKLAGKAGEVAADEIGDLVGPAIDDLFVAGSDAIVRSWKGLFRSDGSAGEGNSGNYIHT